jgi:hypothetical protein
MRSSWGGVEGLCFFPQDGNTRFDTRHHGFTLNHGLGGDLWRWTHGLQY